MRSFYICDKNDFVGHHYRFQNGHYLDLTDGRILLLAESLDLVFHAKWLAQPHVLELPHALSRETLTQEHVAALQGLVSASTADNAWTLAKKISAIHPLMHLR